MTETQKQIADRIVAVFKDRNGVLLNTWQVFRLIAGSGFENLDVLYVIDVLVKDEILINKGGVNNDKHILHPQNGWAYSSYDELLTKRQAESEAKQKKEDVEYEKIHLEIENLRNQFFDYDETKARAIRSERIAIASIAVTAIITLLQWLCNRPA